LITRINQNRLPPDMEWRLEKMRFESIITGNYLKAVMVLLFGTIAAALAFLAPH
jgi:hypothetical protein